MSTLSTSLYGASTNKGIGGLVSGLDTDDLVNQMTARTRNKINRQYQAKQKSLYKQTAYREVSSKLLSFSNKYFSYSSGSTSNILSSSFFKSNTIESSSKYVSVSGDADNIKNFSISSISSVATYANFASTKAVTDKSFSTSPITDYTSSLAGATMSIEYDGTICSLTIDKDFGSGDHEVTLEEVAIQLNKQLSTIAGNEGNALLKYKADTSNNKIVFETGTAKLTAANYIALSSLKMEVGQVASSTAPIDISSLTREDSEILSNKNAYMTFDFNGVQKTINLNETVTNASDLKIYLQSELDKAYGTNSDDTKKVTVNYDETSKELTFESTANTDLFGVSSISTDLRNFIGIEPTTYNRVNKTSSIDDANLATTLVSGDIEDGKTGYAISVNGKKFEFEKTATLADIMKEINNDADAGVNIYYSSTTDTFSVNSTETGSNQGVEIKDLTGNLSASLFGSGANNLLEAGEYLEYDETNNKYNIFSNTSGVKTNIGTATYDDLTNVYTIDYSAVGVTDKTGIGSYNVNKGEDTTMTYNLNGVPTTVTRSTANFSIDGINIDLNEKAAGSITEDVTFSVTNNSDEVVEKVKQFITDYNEVISLINTKTSEKPDRGYQPLTPEQSDEMEKEEIDNWTKEAKKGILFGDSKMNNALYGLRSSMSGKTSVSSLVLADMGISVASMDTSGKLTFNEEKFKTKLAQNSDEIVALFSGSSTDSGAIQGIAVQIQSILKDNVGSYGSTGILIDEAGMDNSISSDQNYISERIEEYDDKMAELKIDLKKERERYWNKFSALEKTMSNLNSQSSWLTDMMGS